MIKAGGAGTEITEMISDRVRSTGILVRAGSIFTTIADLIATVRTVMNFRPDVESIESNPVILIRMIGPLSTTSRNEIRKARRKMRN